MPPQMPMVAFAALVVVADDSNATTPIEQTIFKAVRGRWYGVGHSPDRYFDNATIRLQRLILENAFRLNMVY